jgi:subtilisin family serine protease
LNIASANLSLGGGAYASRDVCDGLAPAITDVIALLYNVGIATVAAAGNGGNADGISHPACVTHAVSVGATTKADAVGSYSNSGPLLSLLAPGSSIYSSVPGGGFDYLSGTSMATPHVSGAWALIRDKTPDATVDEVLQALAETGVPITDARNGLTRSRIQVDGALSLSILPGELTLTLSADNAAEVYVNGVLAGTTSDWKTAGVFKVSLQAGPNVVAVKGIDAGGVAGLLAELTWGNDAGYTDTSWKVSKVAPSGWETLGFDDSAWALATSYGTYGASPWLLRVTGFPEESTAQWIWTQDNDNDNEVYFRYHILVPK